MPESTQAPMENGGVSGGPRSQEKTAKTPVTPTPVDGVKLQWLLGRAVLIGWPQGSKGTSRPWKHLTLSHMTPNYLAGLAHGNVGVALGAVSEGLCAIDADADEFADAMLKLNPCLKDTLITHGARGRVFWLRFTGAYPERTVRFKDRDDRALGEFRSNGSQSIVAGTHPEGMPYTFVVKKPVIDIPYNLIKWPEYLKNSPNVTQDVTQDGIQDNAGAIQDTPSKYTDHMDNPVVSCVVPVSSCVLLYNNEENIIDKCIARSSHTSHRLLFDLARGALTLKADDAGKRRMFNQWYEKSRPCLRPEQSRDDYWFEFRQACDKARFPLGASPALGMAWERSALPPFPPAVELYTDPELRRLVALCYHLQVAHGDNPFYLSSYKAANLFGHPEHVKSWHRLKELCRDKVILLVKKGDRRRASEFRFIGEPPAQNCDNPQKLT